MQGMFWGGVLLSSVPLLLGIGIGGFVLHRHLTRAERTAPPIDAADTPPARRLS